MPMRAPKAMTIRQALFGVFIRPTSHIPFVHGPQTRSINAYLKKVPRGSTLLSDPAHPINEAIQSRLVHITLSTGGIDPSPTFLRSLIAGLDTSKGVEEVVRQVGKNKQGLPVVKITTKQRLFEEAQVARRTKTASKKNADTSKQLEMSWGIDRAGDLKHRLKRMQEWLREGRAVEVLVARKKKGKSVDLPEAQELLSDMRSAASEVEGVEESKAMEGQIGGQATLHFKMKASAKTGTQETPMAMLKRQREEKLAKKEVDKAERKKVLDERDRIRKEAEKQRQTMQVA